MQRILWPVAFIFLINCGFDGSSFGAISIGTVAVGNPGNASHSSGLGAVATSYRIGAYEVTNEQYAAFLNAKAVSDPLSLYHASMGSDIVGGISRSGSSGSYSYAVRANMGNKPANWVTWYSSIRFANWLHNNQGSGDTETGAYTLGALGAGGIPTNGDSIIRNANATWFLPSESEWFKAAFYNPATSSYYAFPTRSDLTPFLANTATGGTGDITNPGPEVANYGSNAFWGGRLSVTTVGSAGATSPYGTYDQGGNVSEWYEELRTVAGSLGRGHRGGSYTSSSSDMAIIGTTASGTPSAGLRTRGFRVARVSLAPQSGDFNGDGGVDGDDMLTWQRGQSPSSGDLTAWRMHFGVPAPIGAASTAAPEPASCVLGIMGAFLLIARRRNLR